MNEKLLFVSFSYKDSSNQLGLSNGAIDFKEPESFEDIKKLGDKIVETAKKQNFNITNVIVLYWKVLGKEGTEYERQDRQEKQGKRNERVGYFS